MTVGMAGDSGKGYRKRQVVSADLSQTNRSQKMQNENRVVSYAFLLYQVAIAPLEPDATENHTLFILHYRVVAEQEMVRSQDLQDSHEMVRSQGLL